MTRGSRPATATRTMTTPTPSVPTQAPAATPAPTVDPELAHRVRTAGARLRDALDRIDALDAGRALLRERADNSEVAVDAAEAALGVARASAHSARCGLDDYDRDIAAPVHAAAAAAQTDHRQARAQLAENDPRSVDLRR